MEQNHIKIESNSQALNRRLALTEKLITEITRNKEELEIRVKVADKEIQRLQTSLEAVEGAHYSELNKLRTETAHFTAKSAKDLSMARLILSEEQEKCKKLEQRCGEIQEHAKRHISELAKSLERHDDSAEKLLIANNEIVNLENAVMLLQQQKITSTRDNDAECHRLQHALEACHNEIRLRMIEANEITKECTMEKSRAEQLRKDLLVSNASLKKCEQNYQLLDQEKKKLSDIIDDLKLEKESVLQKFNDLSKETVEMKQLASKARAEADEVCCY
jgi:chromosome segregation ATPase